ncbi:hypothetical protein E2C01_023827 [Portunus trituberculatus]|uniref:Uncharacterized protein n=1 Tax=Portunus trituberculatus TaxID=210409 RepID=A0A5B7E8Y9_PORTR|nr:hypothetical protein [Portunus trituberculatus]
MPHLKNRVETVTGVYGKALSFCVSFRCLGFRACGALVPLNTGTEASAFTRGASLCHHRIHRKLSGQLPVLADVMKS